jgi:hypothetical protein
MSHLAGKLYLAAALAAILSVTSAVAADDPPMPKLSQGVFGGPTGSNGYSPGGRPYAQPNPIPAPQNRPLSPYLPGGSLYSPFNMGQLPGSAGVRALPAPKPAAPTGRFYVVWTKYLKRMNGIVDVVGKGRVGPYSWREAQSRSYYLNTYAVLTHRGRYFFTAAAAAVRP